MSKNMSLSIDPLKKQLKPLAKFHYLIFIVIMLGGVAFTVYKINDILNTPADQAYKTDKEKVLLNDNFDQTTIDKLKKLHFSNNPEPINLPPGRNNPFLE